MTSKIKHGSRIIIAGGGIHGASIAYYLNKCDPTLKITIIEATAIAAAASGKSGGFLARDWGNNDTQALHEISYRLHEELAIELGIESYRKLPTLSVSRRKGKSIPSWLDKSAVSTELLEGDTAQITSYELTHKLIAASKCEVIIGKVEKVEIVNNTATGVQVSEGVGIVECDYFVVSLGPWSGVFCEDNFGVETPMEGVKSSSMIFHSIKESADEPFALFCDEDNNGCHLELYPRCNGDVYVCGLGGSDYVSGDRLRSGGDCDSADKIEHNPNRIKSAKKSIQNISSVIGNRNPDVVQACMRPCPPDSLPYIGPIPNTSNAYISAGHNCWGILWAPVSGMAISELILEGSSKIIDLSPFSPGRFNKRSSKRGRKIGTSDIGEQW